MQTLYRAGKKYSVEVYELGGFGGYNHFFRAFKKKNMVLLQCNITKDLKIDRNEK